MMTDRIDASSLPFALKNEQNAYNDNDSDINLDDIDNFSSMSFLSISMNDSVILDEPNEFLRLTTMVRSAYFSYLHKCLLNNYLTCYEEGSCKMPNIEIKKCADQMELHAVRLALEVNLYRQNMLRMIADIKSHTVRKKAYKKLVIFLEAPENRIDIAVQTEDTCIDLHETDDVQNTHITSNCERESVLPTVNSTSFYENVMKDSDDDTSMQVLQEKESDDATKDQTDSQVMDDIKEDEDENSQDSLLQHMEDMFCESDDSSDLTKLIEKHSGVTKANIDKEINKMCLEADLMDTSLCGVSQNNNISKPTAAKRNTSQGKVSFSRYKEMQNRKANLKGINGNEILENKQKQKSNAIWFVDRVHYVTKLKSIMIELSLTNYRKHGRIKEKFLQLFGESEEEEMMPDSPICIEDHLPACKQRISRWAVQYLMPFYKKKRIKNRELFKDVARYITDMLIIEDTFPEQEYVIKYIERYFKNKKFIKTKQDIYL